MSGNDVSSAAYSQMKRLAEKDGSINLNFNLNYDDLIDANLAGRTVRFGNDVTVEVFMKHSANNTAHGAVGTFVHESSHVTPLLEVLILEPSLMNYEHLNVKSFIITPVKN